MQINSFLNHPPNIYKHRSDKTDANYIFSILIPTWNNLEFLKKCVESIRKNSRYQHQIILHLNEGIDGSKEWAEQQNIDFTLSDTNIGICYAMNFARTLATCDLLVYFNDDMYACPDWDYWLHKETLQANSPYFFISSTIIEPKFTSNKCVIAPMDFGRHPSSFNEKELLKKYNIPVKNDWNGATWPPSVLPTKLWDLVGGYSTEFSPGMYSDPDFSMKLWHFGVRYFKGVGASRVYHFMSQSTKKLSKPKLNGSKIFLRKWGVSSKLFTTFYLRRGDDWNGPLPEPHENLRFKLKKLFGNIKRLAT